MITLLRRLRIVERRRARAAMDAPRRRDLTSRTDQLRRMLRVGSPLVGLTLIATGFVFAYRFPDHGELLLLAWSLSGLGAIALSPLASRASARMVVVLSVLLTVAPCTALLASTAEPAAILAVVSSFAMLPVAVPLFLPWTRALRTAWVLVYTSVFGGLTVITGFGYLSTTQRMDIFTNLAFGSFIGWMGAEMLERMRERNLAQQSELLRLNSKLQARATTDALTGLANRRQLDNDLQILTDSRASAHGSYAFIMLDLDQFKHLNDEFGHAVGDAALRSVSAELRRVIRDGDSVYRYGGEEFLVIMPNTTAEDAVSAADRIRKAVAALKIATAERGSTHVTISGGVAFSTLANERWETVLAAADLALYEAKATGRNRICRAAAGVTVPAANSGSAPRSANQKDQPTLASPLVP